MNRRLNTHDDPSGLFAAIGTAAAAVLSLVAIFLPLPPGFTEAVLGVIASVGALWTALAIRRHAYAPATVETVRNLARLERTDPDDDEEDPLWGP